MIYSFALYERGADANRLLVQTDNFDRALDVNEDVKLDLGSTAKLRTLVELPRRDGRTPRRARGARPGGALRRPDRIRGTA